MFSGESVTAVQSGVAPVRYREVMTVDVGAGPHLHLGYVKESGHVWVSDTGGDTITVLDHADGHVIDRWRIGRGAAHFSFDAGCNVGVVALRSADEAVIVNPQTRTVIERVALTAGSAPTGTMPAFDRGIVYTLNEGNGTVTAVDVSSAQVVSTIGVGGLPKWGQPWGASYKPITKPVGKTYVVSTESDDVTVFDDNTNEVICRIPVGHRPNRNAIFREHGNIYISNEADDTVTVIRIADDEVLATVPVNHRPFRMLPIMAINGRDEMWVLGAGDAATGKGTVAAVSGTDHVVTRTIDVVDAPANWVVNPQKRLFIVGSSCRQLLVYDFVSDGPVGVTQLGHDPAPGAISGLIHTAAGSLFILNDDSTVTVLRDQNT
ncbi:MAG TPA: hypothetical protein VGN33_12540 [Leifsonia sp.]|nr:hypothetical protein [Leifsonia sp.]